MPQLWELLCQYFVPTIRERDYRLVLMFYFSPNATQHQTVGHKPKGAVVAGGVFSREGLNSKIGMSQNALKHVLRCVTPVFLLNK